jgi:hypothetical protein
MNTRNFIQMMQVAFNKNAYICSPKCRGSSAG